MIDERVGANPRRGQLQNTKRLKKKVLWQAKEIDRLRDENLALRQHHVQLYAELMKSSADLTYLTKIHSEMSVDSSNCVLCGADRSKNDENSNIISLQTFE
jgi:hypothetical protein